MVGEHAEDIGKLKADNKRTLENVDNLFKSNEKRKTEINDFKLELNSIHHTVEETNQTANRVVEFMEELKISMAKLVKSINHIDERVTALETNRFDSVKIFKWLGTWRGTFFMCFALLVIVGVVVPDAREFILDIFGTVKIPGVK